MRSTSARDTIEGRVLETLEAFDRPDALPHDPHFYGRVMTRLAQGERLQGGFTALLKPALITALALLNLTTAVLVLGARGRQASARQRTEFAQALAADLNLADEARPLIDAGRE